MKYITPDIKLSTQTEKHFSTEVSFDHHMLIWFISGETKVTQADATYVFKAGDIFLIPRNLLITVYNESYQSVVMHLTVDRLKAFYAQQPPVAISPAYPTIRHFPPHPLLQSCLSSLLPYFDINDPFPENIAELKLTEAITILRTVDPTIDHTLANFEDPHKLDLIDFMEKHYMFNMTLEKFGYLTGRSLSTFHRDFKKKFNTSPQKWLTRKRLELAHYQIREKNKRPAEVYLDAGFEDLSHFSFAFKKHYGYSPNKVTHPS
ncbi:AraC family transcriptional regulator [Chitinophaga sp.]|uniref:AraC family transcriptional regulator n=1 Tax=Chitinophaga sp. TaxID=1869181 RepID=UPI0031DD20E4